MHSQTLKETQDYNVKQMYITPHFIKYIINILK